MRWIIGMLLLGGCDRLFGFELSDAALDATIDVALSGHDEDADGFDDAIDVCPSLAGAQEDRDKDGVGDACDPHPDLAIDRIRAFHSFTDATEWTTRGGTWVREPDAIRAEALEGYKLLVWNVGVLEAPTIIATLADRVPLEPTPRYGIYLVTDPLDPGAFPRGLVCYYDRATANLGLYDKRTDPLVSYGSVTAPTGEPLRLTLQSSRPVLDGPTGSPRCAATDGVTDAMHVTTVDPTPVAKAQVGLWTYTGGVTFRSVTIIDRRPQP